METTRALCLLVLVGCGGTSGSGDPVPSGPDAAVDTDPSLADRIESDVVGTYGFRIHTAAMMDLPIVGQTESVTATTGLAEVRRVGDTFELTEAGCHVESTAGDAVETIIPDRVPRSAAPSVSAIAFAESGGAVSWTRAEAITLVGVELADPAGDDLPTTADDSRVVDQDGDGKPGVTVSLSGLASGDIYVVQRTRSTYTGGTLDAPGELAAGYQGGTEQVTIGSTNPLLEQPIPSSPHPDPSQNWIRLVRVSDGYDCDRVVAEAADLFR